jgi:hypothetical protein
MAAMSNAERHARWRARHKQEIGELKTKATQAEERARKPNIVTPPALLPGITKVRSNQRGEHRQSSTVGPEVIPDLEVAKKAFSDRMRQARIAAGLSQAEIAVRLFGPDIDGMYRKRYINWEIGRSFMAQNVIPAFAAVVGVDCNFLFDWSHQPRAVDAA